MTSAADELNHNPKRAGVVVEAEAWRASEVAQALLRAVSALLRTQ